MKASFDTWGQVTSQTNLWLKWQRAFFGPHLTHLLHPPPPFPPALARRASLSALPFPRRKALGAARALDAALQAVLADELAAVVLAKRARALDRAPAAPALAVVAAAARLTMRAKTANHLVWVLQLRGLQGYQLFLQSISLGEPKTSTKKGVRKGSSGAPSCGKTSSGHPGLFGGPFGGFLLPGASNQGSTRGVRNQKPHLLPIGGLDWWLGSEGLFPSARSRGSNQQLMFFEHGESPRDPHLRRDAFELSLDSLAPIGPGNESVSLL